MKALQVLPPALPSLSPTESLAVHGRWGASLQAQLVSHSGGQSKSMTTDLWALAIPLPLSPHIRFGSEKGMAVFSLNMCSQPWG